MPVDDDNDDDDDNSCIVWSLGMGILNYLNLEKFQGILFKLRRSKIKFKRIVCR